MELYQILQTPLVTEKSTNLEQQKKYTVLVHPASTKIDVKRAVEKVYHVKVAMVHMLITPSKSRMVARGRSVTKRSEQKKAIITLKKGEKGLDFIKTKKTK